MKRISYVGNTEKFWEARKKSRSALDRDFARRSATEQHQIEAKMRVHHNAMREAKKLA